ncbi:MAG: hypothetical protein PHT88_04805 [Candidatus Moranbacteria bacterium]|nr:hypothetical protein [Candidatus Moranbacteria bacterium]
MLKASTALRNAMLVTGSLKARMDGGFLKLYSGAVPSDADAALGSAVLLCLITKDGDGTTGLTFATTATGGAVTKTVAEVWAGANVATGTVSFWRFVKTGDTGGASTTEERVQGQAALTGSELLMTSLSLTSGAPNHIDYCTLALPA